MYIKQYVKKYCIFIIHKKMFSKKFISIFFFYAIKLPYNFVPMILLFDITKDYFTFQIDIYFYNI